jgi:serine/threonine protein kinase
VATDFFRADTIYFKVTERITHEPLPRLHDEEPRRAGVVIRTLVLSLKLLHDQRIVHGDLKPSNILVQSVADSASGLSTAKLIDFDDSYFAGDPPTPDLIGGDPRFAAPEWFRYGRSEPGEVSGEILTCAADVFALGLVIHHQLTGEMPAFDEAAFEGCAGLAAMADAPITPRSTVHPDMRALIGRMLHPDSGARPALDAILKVIGDNKLYVRQSGSPSTPADPSGPGAGGASRMRSSMGRRSPRTEVSGGSGRRIVSSIKPRTERG